MINVAILGYGTVGSGVFEVLNENKESISRRAGQELLRPVHIQFQSCPIQLKKHDVSYTSYSFKFPVPHGSYH